MAKKNIVLKDGVDIETVKKFDDGFSIVCLKTREALAQACEPLGKNLALDVTGREPFESGVDEFYSLCDKDNNSAAVLHVITRGRRHKVENIIGHGGQAPDKKYFPYLKSFMQERDYRPSSIVVRMSVLREYDEDHESLKNLDRRNLPEGFRYKYWLELGSYDNVKLPQKMFVPRLTLNGKEFEPKAQVNEIEVERDIHYVWRNQFGYYREDGPANVVFDVKTGKVIHEHWAQTDRHYDIEDGEYYHGHRVDGPAKFDLDPQTDVIIKEIWALNGKLHRIDGPAVIYRDAKTQVTTHERWEIQDKQNRIDGPSMIDRDPETGKITAEVWSIQDKNHRVGAPAATMTDPETDIVIVEAWMQNGEFCRPDSPDKAFIRRNPKTGEVLFQANTADMWNDLNDLDEWSMEKEESYKKERNMLHDLGIYGRNWIILC